MRAPRRPEPVDPSPFDLPGSGGAAALCLHGLTGTPYEVRPLGRALSAAGIRALGPALPGHNETPEALARVSHEEWLAAGRDALRALRADHPRVFGVGLSLGGLLTLQLAAEGGFDAAVVIGTPLRLRAPLPTLIPVLKHVVPQVRKRLGPDIREAEARERHPGYGVMPLAGVHELIRLQRRVQADLPRVTAPLLVAHGAHDRTANPTDASEILEAVRSSERELLILESSAHVVPVDFDGAALAGAACDFLVQFV